jgi:hypothetical protein
LWSAKNTLSGSKSFTQRFFPARIRDAGHREWTSLQLGNSLECSVVGLVAPPSVNSDLVFLAFHVSLVDGQLLTKCSILQSDKSLTTEHKNDKSNPEQNCVQHEEDCAVI